MMAERKRNILSIEVAVDVQPGMQVMPCRTITIGVDGQC